MDEGVGVALIVVGACLLTVTGLVLWPRVPVPAGLGLAAAAGLAIGAGALLVQEGASPADWVVTLAVTGSVAPLHGRLLFGRPGRREGGVLAEDVPGA